MNRVLRSILFLLCLSLWAVGPRAEGQSPASLSVQTHAGLTITGSVGTVYTVQSTADVTLSNGWTAAGIVQLPSNPYL